MVLGDSDSDRDHAVPPRRGIPVRTQAALLAGGLAAQLSRMSGRGRGSVIGGKVALLIDPRGLEQLARGRSTVVVTGTNGKSTTSRLLAAAVATAGPVAHNDLGSNMREGLLVALAAHRDAPYAVLETDELYLGVVSRSVQPSVVVLLNLSREYTRGATLARTVGHWRETLAAIDWPCTVVANVDDPNVSWAVEVVGAGLPSSPVRVVPVAAGLLWAGDAAICVRCGHRLRWEGPQWSCPACARARPRPAWSSGEHGWSGPAGRAGELDLQLAGAGSRSGALLAAAAAQAMGVEPVGAMRAMHDVEGVDGRYVLIPVGDRHHVSLQLAKNPAGWAQAIELACDDGAPVVFIIERWGIKDALSLWDAPVERLSGRTVVVSGARRLDLATWLETGGAVPEVVADPTAAVLRCPPGRVTVACNYPAFVARRRQWAGRSSTDHVSVGRSKRWSRWRRSTSSVSSPPRTMTP